MTQTADDLESQAIEAAYRDKLSGLFDMFVRRMMDRSDDHDGEQKSVREFEVGLKVARRARELALGAIQASSKTLSRTEGKNA
jgi:hypothetical protein